jgi:superfamily I DNA and/or RNA helicase
VEPSTLIALHALAPHACPRVILVGDPQQLPATVLSRDAAAARLARSLFQRLQDAHVPATLLEAPPSLPPPLVLIGHAASFTPY